MNKLLVVQTCGTTSDIDSNWFGIASVSYAKLNNQAKIDVIDANTGNRLIHSKTKVDIDPLITYLGIGYRF
ncbi:OmpW family outer membrane protein [Acinetobacter sp. Tol 5]|uniref:OmpW family outer membrane protein n=1 Tax=Acinetobacter sp. (strain Tol 5) TaxID=710648 RepID=UPI00226B93A0|nr:OmpW family outer membrane protein [Acinetobacter sp. Tol 5]